MAAEPGEITALLEAWRGGTRAARDQLFTRLYPELKNLARLHVRQDGGRSLFATDLLHESYDRMMRQTETSWENRAHFMAVAGQIFRRVLVDRSRRRNAQKRDPQRALEPEIELRVGDRILDLLAVDRALNALADVDDSAAQVVELRFFAGLENEEVAEVLGLGRSTVTRRWRFARAWLRAHLEA